MEILEEKPVALFEVKSQIAKIKKRDKEVNYRLNKVDEYLKTFLTLSEKEGKDLYDKVEKLKIPRLKEVHIMKLIDLMPETADDAKVVLQNYAVTVSQDNLKKIVELLATVKQK